MADHVCVLTCPWSYGHTRHAMQAPEVYKGERIRPKVDVYSFAVCLWQMFYRVIVCAVMRWNAHAHVRALPTQTDERLVCPASRTRA
jgi:hypothetical protein